MRPRLYSYYRSTCSWRVRLALHYKEIEFELVPIHLVRDGGEQHSQKHRARNAMAQVPVWEDGVVTLGQSVAIIEYLDECFPEPNLLPSSRPERAMCRQLVEIINSGTQPLQNLAVNQALKNDGGFDAEQVNAWNQKWITQGLRAYQRICEKTSGDFSIGDRVSMADLFLVPQLYNARRFEIEIQEFSLLREIEKKLESLDAFKRAHPDAQQDAPG